VNLNRDWWVERWHLLLLHIGNSFARTLEASEYQVIKRLIGENKVSTCEITDIIIEVLGKISKL